MEIDRSQLKDLFTRYLRGIEGAKRDLKREVGEILEEARTRRLEEVKKKIKAHG